MGESTSDEFEAVAKEVLAAKAEYQAVVRQTGNFGDADRSRLDRAEQIFAQRVSASRVIDLTAELTTAKARIVEGWLPIVLCPTDGEWRAVLLPDGSEVVAAFEGQGLGSMARRWRMKAFAYHNPSRPSGDIRGGVEVSTAAFDTFVIQDLPKGVLPTHFRPNDTVYGAARALTKDAAG